MIKNSFNSLPIGRIIPKGYLKTQLTAQANNLTGNMEEYEEYSMKSGWLGGDGESWERGTYYVHGLIPLAYILKDEKLLNKCDKWINFSLKSQQEDGNFGPDSLIKDEAYDWWPRMPMLMALRDYFVILEDNGTTRTDIIDFLINYFAFMKKNIENYPLSSWGHARGSDAIEVILWLYNYFNEIEEVKWLVDLANTVLSQSQDWEAEMRAGGAVRHHVVNTTQGFKQPFFKYKLTEDEECIESFKKGMQSIRRDHGRIDNLPNADEPARDNLPTRGTETCAVVEGIHSMVLAGEICGESFVYDIAEGYAYNNLPNCFTYDVSGYCYYQLQNQVMATRGTHGFLNDHGDSSALGISGFECCFSNLHMGYPKFVQFMWMEQNSDTLVLTMYGENEITTQFGGKKVVFEQITNYPYSDDVRLIYKGENAKFNLKLRVPQWSKSFSINGEKHVAENGFVTINKEFETDEELNIKLSSEIKVIPWHHNSKYVKKGAAIYCLPIKENWVESLDNRLRGIKYDGKCGMKSYETYPDENWNYSFIENKFEFIENSCYDNSKYISPENIPCSLKVNMNEVLNWGLNGNVCDTIENAKFGKTVEKSLIPYAFTRLRISVFPKSNEELIQDILNFRGDEVDVEIGVEKKIVSVIFKPLHRTECVVIAKEQGGEFRIVNKLKSNAYIFSNDAYGKRIEMDKCSFMCENTEGVEVKTAFIAEGEIVAVSK